MYRLFLNSTEQSSQGSPLQVRVDADAPLVPKEKSTDQMATLSFTTSFLVVLLALLIFSPQEARAVEDLPQCTNEAAVWSSAWAFPAAAQRLFNSDMTTPRNRGLSTSQKRSRVLNRVRLYHQGVGRLSDRDIADTIVWAANCTRNDFAYLAAVIEKESNYCLHRHNRAGGDSGCGQFTTVALQEMKNQLRLSGQFRPNHANHQAQKAFRSMIDQCFRASSRPSYSRNSLTTFERFLSRSFREIQEDLREPVNMDIDILLTAVYLKFLSSISGGYIVPGTAPGGLARYNGGGTPGYAASANSLAQTIELRCEPDSYGPTVMAMACLFEEESTEHCLEEKISALETPDFLDL